MDKNAGKSAATVNFVTSLPCNKKTYSFLILFKSFWLVWLHLIMLVALAFSLPMDTAPFLHMDEFMTVDLGRNILNPGTDWSIAWLTSQDKPFFILSYLGPILQESVFLAAGEYGPRLSGLAGGLFAATMMVGWLVARGTSRCAAQILGLTLLLDPLFVQAYTVARVDGWSIGICLASCWVIRSGAGAHKFALIVAGALAALAFFIWPSAAFLMPLIFLELLDVMIRQQASNGFKKKVFIPVTLFCLGVLSASIMALLPVAPQLMVHLSSMVEGLIVNTRTVSGEAEQLSQSPVLSPIIEFRRVIKHSPFLPLMALIAIVAYKQWRLMFAALVVTTLMLSTVIYMNRVIYLLPYFIVAIAAVFQSTHKPSLLHYSRTLKIKYLGLALILVWGGGLSIVARQMLITYDKSAKDQALVHRAAKDMVGAGNHRVLLLSPLELYYAGRSMDWKMYRPYISIDQDITQKDLQGLLDHVDFIILEKQVLTEKLALSLEAEEFEAVCTYNLYQHNDIEEGDGLITSNLWRLRSLFHIHHQPYGPYILYTRI